MKKITSLLLVLTLCTTLSAQQSLWNTRPVVSPEVHADGTVTFRLSAPKAVKVEVTGDFCAQGWASMQEHDGIWEYTTEPLLPEIYMYNFIVDGLKIQDPSNIHLIRDVQSVFSVFIVSAEDGDRGSLYGVHDVPHGTVSRLWYNSPGLNMKRRLTVYTPAGYDEGNTRYPVFYLLHGMGGDEEAWVSLGRTAQILDNLIAAGKAKPMIVVMTNGNAGFAAAPGESAEGLVQPIWGGQSTKDGAFEESFMDVVNYVDKHYRTIRKGSARAIAGLSMGGFHSLHISKYYPGTFDYVGLFSAATEPWDGATSPVYKDLDARLAKQFAANPRLYWIGIGKDDFLYKANVEWRKRLDDAGYKYEYMETDGGHIWRNWRIYLAEFSQKLFR